MPPVVASLPIGNLPFANGTRHDDRVSPLLMAGSGFSSGGKLAAKEKRGDPGPARGLRLPDPR